MTDRTMVKALRVVGAVLVIGIFLVQEQLWAGSLDSPAAPTNAISGMYTVDDIYKIINVRTPPGSVLAFQEPTGGPTNGTMHTLTEIMAMAKIRKPIAKTGQTVYLAPGGGDGHLREGGVWPNPRFTINGDATVTDNLTGLMWSQDANLGSGKQTWEDALTTANALTTAGYTDWRLPNRPELLSLHAMQMNTPCVPNTAGTGRCSTGNPFNNLQITAHYWSSTLAMSTWSTTKSAWYVGMRYGLVDFALRTDSHYVWAVRNNE